MQYDFDTPIDRTHTWSIKHDFKKENGKADDILPLWVADMDFRSYPCLYSIRFLSPDSSGTPQIMMR